MAANSRFAVAVHCLSMIAWGDENCRSSREIARSVATNPVVIRRLLVRLQRAGLVRSEHGARGGFRLARPARRITLLDVYAAVEDGPLFGLREESNASCPVACRMSAILRSVFGRLERRLQPELRRTSLADVVGRIRR